MLTWMHGIGVARSLDGRETEWAGEESRKYCSQMGEDAAVEVSVSGPGTSLEARNQFRHAFSGARDGMV